MEITIFMKINFVFYIWKICVLHLENRIFKFHQNGVEEGIHRLGMSLVKRLRFGIFCFRDSKFQKFEVCFCNTNLRNLLREFMNFEFEVWNYMMFEIVGFIPNLFLISSIKYSKTFDHYKKKKKSTFSNRELICICT